MGGAADHEPVRRRTVVWLLSVPLAVAGSQVAHALAYRFVTPDGSSRADLLASTGHSYLDYLPLVTAVGVVLVVMALAGELARSVRSRGPSTALPSVWRFAMLAPAIFVTQEQLERLTHDGSVSFASTLQPTLLVGLLLQAPFALIATLAARTLLRAVRAVALVLVRPPRLRTRETVRRWSAARTLCPRIPALALGYGSRAPPPLTG